MSARLRHATRILLTGLLLAAPPAVGRGEAADARGRRGVVPDLIPHLRFLWRVLPALADGFAVTMGIAVAALALAIGFVLRSPALGSLEGDSDHVADRCRKGEFIVLPDARSTNMLEAKHASKLTLDEGGNVKHCRDPERIEIRVGEFAGPGVGNGVVCDNMGFGTERRKIARKIYAFQN